MKAIFILIAALLLISCYDITPPATHQQGITTITFKVAWPWDSSITYAKGYEVTMPQFAPGGAIYESLRDKNVGIQPPSLIAGTTQQTYYSSPSAGWEQWWKWVGSQQ